MTNYTLSDTLQLNDDKVCCTDCGRWEYVEKIEAGAKIRHSSRCDLNAQPVAAKPQKKEPATVESATTVEAPQAPEVELPKSVTNAIKWIEEAKAEGNEEDYQEYVEDARKLLAKGKKQMADWVPGSGGPHGLAQLKAGIEHLEAYLNQIAE